MTLSKASGKSSLYMCIYRASDDSLSLPIVDRKYVFNRRITLKDLSADADETGMQRSISIHLNTFGYRMGSAMETSASLKESGRSFTSTFAHLPFQRPTSRLNSWLSAAGISPPYDK